MSLYFKLSQASKKSCQVVSILSGILLGILSLEKIAAAQEAPVLELRIKDHKYFPENLKVKANERFKIKVTNEDATSEEFESKTMIIEKFIGPQRSITVVLGPLKPGSYDFFGCFHKATAKGQIVAE